MLVQARIPDVDKRDLEAHFLAGGNVERVVRALIAADRAGIALDFRTAAAHRPRRPRRARGRADQRQAQGDRLPQPGRRQERGRRRGQGRHPGAGQGARHGAHQHRAPGRRRRRGDDHRARRRGHRLDHRLEGQRTRTCSRTPTASRKTVLARGLDAGTAFEIVSIDIADVDVGDNIGARLQADQAEADKRVAQANAEKRRAMAVAAEQEFKAQVVRRTAPRSCWPRPRCRWRWPRRCGAATSA